MNSQHLQLFHCLTIIVRHCVSYPIHLSNNTLTESCYCLQVDCGLKATKHILETGKEMSAFLGEQEGAPGPHSVAQRRNNPLPSMTRLLPSNAPLSRHQLPLVSNPIVGSSRVASAQGTSAVRRGNSTGEPVSQRRPRRAVHSASSLTSRGRTNPTRSDANITAPFRQEGAPALRRVPK